MKNQICFGFAGSSKRDRRRQPPGYKPTPNPSQEGILKRSLHQDIIFVPVVA